MNERKTENIVRDLLSKAGYYDDDNVITVEEQKSQNATIQKLLKNAGKTGGGGVGKPEFIIKSNAENSFVMLIECKADVKRHQSLEMSLLVDYAVDGVLHYASHLAREFNVIALGVSGETKKELKISSLSLGERS